VSRVNKKCQAQNFLLKKLLTVISDSVPFTPYLKRLKKLNQIVVLVIICHFDICNGRRSAKPGQGIAKPDSAADWVLQLQVKFLFPK